MNKKTKTIAVAGTAAVVAAAIIGTYVGVCQRIRFDAGDAGKLRRETTKALRAAATQNPDGALAMLEEFAVTEVWRARFPGRFPWLPKVSKELKIPVSQLEGLTEEAFVKFAGNGYPDAAAQGRIRKLLDFAERLEVRCSPEDAKSLRERMLDAHFLVNDFDGAVAILEKGLPGRSANWSKAAIAKIRAHQAEEKKDDAEALRQFAAFGEAMAAEPDNGVPECDPTTGIAYCRAWVLAKNAWRCSEYSKKLGKSDDAAAFLAKAKALYERAVKETEDDDKSLAALKEEMKKAGL